MHSNKAILRFDTCNEDGPANEHILARASSRNRHCDALQRSSVNPPGPENERPRNLTMLTALRLQGKIAD